MRTQKRRNLKGHLTIFDRFKAILDYRNGSQTIDNQ
jgi:hypothetical protein